MDVNMQQDNGRYEQIVQAIQDAVHIKDGAVVLCSAVVTRVAALCVVDNTPHQTLLTAATELLDEFNRLLDMTTVTSFNTQMEVLKNEVSRVEQLLNIDRA